MIGRSCWFGLTIIFLVNQGLAKKNNACNHVSSYYYLKNSPDCFYEPDVLSNTPKILDNHVGPNNWENYTITTEDGYILTMFRIIRENRRGVVMLQHPITTDGSVWVGQRDNSTAFLLWNMGYEVWLPNHRGTYYSEKHTTLCSGDLEYWDFTFHEIAIYDYTAFIKKIYEVTKRQDIAYIGHSMSGTAGLILASLKPEFTKKYIKIMILMAPAAIFKHTRSPIKLLAPFIPYIQKFTKTLGWGGIFTPNSLESILNKLLVFTPTKAILDTVINVYAGGIAHEFDPVLFNIALSLSPKAFSWKIIFQYAQFVNSGRFQFYDYGWKRNMELYNSRKPPEYPIEKIQIPIFQIASTDDSLTTVEDAELLYARLPEVAKVYGNLTISGINHINYQFGKHRIEIVYNKVFSLLNSLYKK